MDLDAFARRLPKAELHCHLMGAVPPATFVELAKRNGVALRTEDPEHVYDFVTFDDFLDIFTRVCHSVRTAEDFSRVTYDSLVLDADRANLRYRELFFNPTNYPGLSYATVVDGILDGAEAARVDRGVVCRPIPAINREQGPAVALELVETILANPRDEVVGIAMDYNEDLALPELFVDAFRRAGEGGLRRSTHAGEFGSAERVRTAIEQLGCERIDHGYGIVNDEETMALARERGIHFTACWSVSVDYHGDDPATTPIRGMVRGGLDVSINSDDPAIYRVDIGGEWANAARVTGLDADDLVRCCLAAVDACYLPDDDRRAMRARFEREIAELREQLA
jgi:adenosine deaminase